MLTLPAASYDVVYGLGWNNRLGIGSDHVPDSRELGSLPGVKSTILSKSSMSMLKGKSAQFYRRHGSWTSPVRSMEEGYSAHSS